MTDLGIPGLEEARFLASGGFGEVYVARQPALNREVAVKVLTAPVLDDVRRKRFDQECRALGALSEHPHIVSLYDAGYTNRERPYLLMPYLRAGSLADRLRSESVIPSGEVRDIGVKIAGALATAHRADVLHRDVKPANILVSEYGEPQLGDFGVARFVDESHTSTGAVTGTLAFTAPELFQGAAPSPSSDVYSLAASLFALISGRPPYAEDADAPLVRILARITSGPPATLAPGSCSSGLRDAIHAGMARDPAERPSDGEALGHLLESSDAAPADGATATMILMPSLSRAARRAAEEDTRVHSVTNQEATTQLPSPKRSIAASAGLVVAVLLLLLLGAAFAVSRLGPHETLASGSVDPTDPAPRDAALDLADAEPTTSPTPAEEILAVPDVADAEPTTSPTPAEEILAVPDVRGKAPGVAGAELIRAGFTVQTQQRQDASVERQVVVSQRPDAGAERPAGAAITLVVAVPAPLEGVDAYVTTNGTQPQGAQTCPGVLGLCLSAPIDEAVNLLGTEDSRFGEQGTVTRQWAIADGEAFISVAADDIGSITQMTVAMNAITDVRVALPEGLLLGESRMGDVVDILGEPHDTAEDAAENFAFYDYIYRVGPEGSISYDFGYNAVIGSADDPGGINDALADKPVLSFTVDYPFDDF